MKTIRDLIDLQPEEEIFAVARHHWVLMIPPLLFCLLLLLMDLVLVVYGSAVGTWAVIFGWTLAAVLIGYVVRVTFLWRNNMVVVTNQRIVDCERSGFFQHLLSDISYGRIKGASVQIKGVWQTVLRYGDVRLELVGQPRPFELYNLPRPKEVLELINRFVHEKPAGSPAPVVDQLIAILDTLSPAVRTKVIEQVSLQYKEE